MRVSVKMSYATPERKNTAGMKGFASTDLIVEEESISFKFQDILWIVKSTRESGRLKTIIQ